MDISLIDQHDLIGAVKYRLKWHIFVGTVAEWILDYKKYDPAWDQGKSKTTFRNNLLVVDEHNADEFLKAMQPYELQPEDVRQLENKDGLVNWPLSFVIDFDKKVYVNGFGEVQTHEYVPEGWTSFEGDPLFYVDEAIKSLWQN